MESRLLSRWRYCRRSVAIATEWQCFAKLVKSKIQLHEQPTVCAYLECCVHQVTAPSPDGVFHPKVWVLRFVDGDARILYRVICSSRNISTALQNILLILDGALSSRQNAFKLNHPLGDWLAQLPRLSLSQPLPEPLGARISQIQREIRRVEFENPEGLEVAGFCPLGIDGYKRSPFVDVRDRFSSSPPFLSSETLRDLTPTPGRGVLCLGRIL